MRIPSAATPPAVPGMVPGAPAPLPGLAPVPGLVPVPGSEVPHAVSADIPMPGPVLPAAAPDPALVAPAPAPVPGAGA